MDKTKIEQFIEKIVSLGPHTKEILNPRLSKKNLHRFIESDLAMPHIAVVMTIAESPAMLTMIQHIPGQWDMEACNLTYTKKDAGTLEFEIELPARTEDGPAVKELTMHYHRRNIRTR